MREGEGASVKLRYRVMLTHRVILMCRVILKYRVILTCRVMLTCRFIRVDVGEGVRVDAVSYTHLTLPTILRV